jgi:hypothetical protein
LRSLLKERGSQPTSLETAGWVLGNQKNNQKLVRAKSSGQCFYAGPFLLCFSLRRTKNPTPPKKKYNKKNLEFVRNGLEETWG